LNNVMTSKIKLSGKNYYLQTLTKEDVSEEYVNWLNDPEITEFLEIKYQTWSKEDTENYVHNAEKSSNQYLFGIYKENQHIGNINIHNINKHTGTYNYGVLIGNKDYWGKGATQEACALMFDFAFKKLQLRKFFGGTYSNQIASRIVLKSLGCKEEGRFTEHSFHKGKLIDQIIYSMTAEQWKQEGYLNHIK